MSHMFTHHSEVTSMDDLKRVLESIPRSTGCVAYVKNGVAVIVRTEDEEIEKEGVDQFFKAVSSDHKMFDADLYGFAVSYSVFNDRTLKFVHESKLMVTDWASTWIQSTNHIGEVRSNTVDRPFIPNPLKSGATK